jgi:hypothetical protein
MKNVGLSLLQSQIAEMEFRAEHLENFQDITNDLKANFTSMDYIRRYSHVGPRSQRTKFYGTSNLSNSTVYRMKNHVEASNPAYTIRRTGSGDVAVYFNNKF